jgi:hypothetical protein
MEQSEITAVWSEIEQIKKEAYQKGMEKAAEQLRDKNDRLDQEIKKVRDLRNEWSTLIATVQSHYLKHHNKQLEVLNENFFNFYEDDRLVVPADHEEFQAALSQMVRMGRDFEIMLKGINEHAILKGCWDKLLMTFKLIEQ